MPLAAPRPCRKVGCGALVRGSITHCDSHKAAAWRARDEHRGTSTERGYGSRWRKARAFFLARHPFCAKHAERGEQKAATVVDHKVPHRLDQARKSGDETAIARAWALFWNSDNWQSLCGDCHNVKTGTGQ